ncbi:MAG: 50S ribosomal protein L11 methyltransferase [Opitutales bacterium]|nr:50S ribosomal protein L11 methyltransferase [Opitutales bacterium]
MIELRCSVEASLAPSLEDYFCELERSPWLLYHEKAEQPTLLMGYFDSQPEALDAWADLQKSFPQLPLRPEIGELADRDWKEAYKANLFPWSFGRLHWVPEWRRAEYPVPAGAAVVYFDAGLAFGTGDHPTTRCCGKRLAEYLAKSANPAAVRVTDAGCGSGILAISAAQLGAKDVFAFDRDLEAVEVTRENCLKNDLPQNAVTVLHAGLEEGLAKAGPREVVLANIISDVLCIYADELVAAVAPGGMLALSGILASEQQSVADVFLKKARALWGEGVVVDGRVDGEWSDVALFRP